MSTRGVVVVAFADRSLGGVSRSALSAGKIWKSLGFNVLFTPFLPIHEGRLSQFVAVGEVQHDLSVPDWKNVALVHLHHGAMSPATQERLERLMAAGRPNEIPLLTKNVFAVNDRLLGLWSGPRATSVPGLWTSLQYRFNCGDFSLTHLPIVVPNVQDSEFFRLPDPQERLEARAKLGLSESDFCVLRIGSPIMDKWSRAYIELARRARSGGIRLILLGVPKAIRAQVEAEGATVLEPTSDDTTLRSLYWAADRFALDARRGETFGNVVFEALLCGLEVAYRARPLRDNTPWELSELPGFAYCKSDRVWLRSSLTRERTASSIESEATAISIAGNYGYPAVRRVYEQAFADLQQASGATQVWAFSRSWLRRVSPVEKLQAAIRHNPMTTRIKEFRLRRVA